MRNHYAVSVLVCLLLASSSAAVQAQVTFSWEGTFSGGEALSITYSFDPSTAVPTDVGSGTTYHQALTSATVTIDGTPLAANLDLTTSGFFIQNDIAINGNTASVDRYQAILQFSPTVSSPIGSFDRIFVIAEAIVPLPSTPPFFTDESLVLDISDLAPFPTLQAAFQLGNAASFTRPPITPAAQAVPSIERLGLAILIASLLIVTAITLRRSPRRPSRRFVGS